MKTIPIFLIVSALALYFAGYFFVVQKRLRNPFISWPITRPLPMEAYYYVNNLSPIYKPLARMDQKLFPTRWVWPPGSSKEYYGLFTNIDLKHIHEFSKPLNQGTQRTTP